MLSHLQGAGRGFGAVGNITARAEQAFTHLRLAEQALAETNFEASETEFAASERLLNDAHAQLTEALASSRSILRLLDVSGRLRSSEELLAAGEQLSRAGQHASRGLAPLLSASVLPQEGQEGKTMVDALAYALKELVQVRDALAEASASLEKVNMDALPADIRPHVEKLAVTIPKAHTALTGFLNQSQVLLSVLGAERQRQYLLLFENNHEIRPTGGFIGSIALVNVDRGVVEDIDVQTVYDPDGQLKEFIAPPSPLLAITNRWYLRDANWFVDFNVSAKKVADFFEKEAGPTVDGVIALTPEVIKELLVITGPIEVPGYNVTVDQNNFVLLTQDQVTYGYDREENRPKQFLHDLTPLLLNRLFAQPAEQSLRVLGALGKSITEKQLLIYFRDPAIQERIREAGWDGSFPTGAQGFLSVNNANIGGHKSDQFVSQELDYRSTIQDSGDVEVILTIRRTHHGPTEKIDYQYPPTENPAFKDNIVYQRVLVPKEAQLLEARGFTPAHDVPQQIRPDAALELTPDAEVVQWQRTQQSLPDGTTIGEEAGYTYFANWQITHPGSTTVGIYRYLLPKQAQLPGLLNASEQYRLYLAKQPGDTRTTIRAEIVLPEGFQIAHTVPADGITQTEPGTMVYRGALKHDLIVGSVYTRKTR